MFLPFGIGLIISAILMNISYRATINLNVEKKARALGMIYPHELRVMDEGGKSEND